MSTRVKRAKYEKDSKAQLVDELKELLSQVIVKSDKAWHNASSKQEEIREHYAALRTKVDAQSEIMIEEIREWSENAREEINKHEKECLDKFNAEEFEASATEIKSLLKDMKSLESRINKKLADVKTNAGAIKKLIDETTEKLDELSQCDLTMKKLKFSYNILELIVKDKKKAFEVKSRASLERIH